jgi:lytic cellulose monooxygenase (C1-hydroxylating)
VRCQSKRFVLTPTDRWANELANDNGDSFKFQLPSDIKPGNYVLRTEFIAMHGNMKELKGQNLKGQIQIYLHCFNLNIAGTGTATPAGVSFPGAYKADESGLTFDPYMTYGIPDPVAAMAHNSKYVSFQSFAECI